MDIKNKRALITGGSSGIGLETARTLLKGGAAVQITGRRAVAVHEAVEQLKPLGDVSGIAADVTTAEGRRRTIAAALHAGRLDILINNAGGVRAGRLDTIAEDEIVMTVEVNLTAPLLLTRAALPLLRESKGTVVNVSSGMALIGMPFYTIYAAVKAGIAHFGEALRRELAHDGVQILTVYPTATDTPMMVSSGTSAEEREAPADVAAAIIEALRYDHRDVIRGGPSRLDMIMRNRDDPEMIDAMLLPQISLLEAASRDHSAL